MFVLGHVGIGRALVGARARALPLAAFAVGALLPDLIDKPLYYSRVWSFITCTRTVGHTGLFLLVLFAVAAATRSRAWLALAAGTSTHALLDWVLDLPSPGRSSTLIAFAWPLLGTHFYSYPFKTPFDQFISLLKLPVLISEIIGAFLLWREYRPRKKPGSLRGQEAGSRT